MSLITGNDLPNSLKGTNSDDTILGNGGNDTVQIYYNGGDDYVQGGDGDDLLIVDFSANPLTTGSEAGAEFRFDLDSGGTGSISAVRNSAGAIDEVNFTQIERVQITGTKALDSVTGLDLDLVQTGGVFDNSSGEVVYAGVRIKAFEVFNDVLLGVGNDRLVLPDFGDDSFNTSAGNDTIVAGYRDQSDEVIAGDGTDLLELNYSGNTYKGAEAGMTFRFDLDSSGTGEAEALRDSNGNGDELSFAGVERVKITGTSRTDAVTALDLDTVLKGGVFDNSTGRVLYGPVELVGFETFNDVLLGSGNDRLVLPDAGDDSFVTGQGNDTILAAFGDHSDEVHAGDANDLLVIDYSKNSYAGDDAGMRFRFDFESGGSGDASAARNRAGDLDELSFDGIERVQATGTAGNDTITGLDFSSLTANGVFDNSKKQVVYGSAKLNGFETFLNIDLGLGNDRVTLPDAGNDSFVTGNGNDTILAAFGDRNDTVEGGAGDDLLVLDYSRNTFRKGGSGLSFIYESSGAEGIATAVKNAAGDLDSLRFESIERLNIKGTAANDLFETGSGDDTLNGSAGNDRISGADLDARGKGEIDLLTGGSGRDTLVLGIEFGTLYNDGLTSNSGLGDYAFIADFHSKEDRLELFGDASSYRLGSSPEKGVGIYFENGAKDELIAILKSANSDSLTRENTIERAIFVD